MVVDPRAREIIDSGSALHQLRRRGDTVVWRYDGRDTGLRIILSEIREGLTGDAVGLISSTGAVSNLQGEYAGTMDS